MSHNFTRLHLATRIHFGLLREAGVRIDVGRMLRQRHYAKGVLAQCRHVASFALLDLADRFADISAADDAKAHLALAALRARAALAKLPVRDGTRSQPMAWSGDTSGFGLTHAMNDLGRGPAASDAQRQRFSPASWLDSRH